MLSEPFLPGGKALEKSRERRDAVPRAAGVVHLGPTRLGVFHEAARICRRRIHDNKTLRDALRPEQLSELPALALHELSVPTDVVKRCYTVLVHSRKDDRQAAFREGDAGSTAEASPREHRDRATRDRR